jgi:dipeptidyl aminopeptidase/acylaminoacyl peptidase
MLAIVLAAIVASNPAPRAVTPEDTYALRVITGLEIAPDGKTLAITVERADEKENAFRHVVYLTDADGRNAHALCRADVECTDPKFSPDGTKLAWLSDEKDDMQLWVGRVGTRRGRQVTSGSEPPTDFDWSPDGTKLVYTRLDGYVRLPPPGAPQAATSTRGGPSRAGRAEVDDVAPYVIDRTQIQRDGEGFLDARRTHLWTVGADGGPTHAITSGPYDDDSPRWSPKGDLIAFVTNRHPDPDVADDTDIWVVPPRGGKARRLAGTPGPDTAPAWSHAGDRIAFVGGSRANDPYQLTRAVVALAAGGAAIDLTGPLDAWVSSDDLVGGASESSRPLWTADDGTVLTLVDRRGANRLVALPSGGGPAAEIFGGAQVAGLVRLDAAAGRIYYTRSTPTVVSELWTASADGTGSRRIFAPDSALQGAVAFVPPEKVVAKNGAGDEIESWLYPPARLDRSKHYPMILYIHGGPQEYDGDFFDTGLENQLFPAKGWAVLRVNYRGSTSYGEAFSRAIWGDWQVREYDDLMAAVDEAIRTHPWIDPERLGVGGWSYGGIMTIWAAAHSRRFKVGVPERFEIDYLSCFGEDQWQAQYLTEFGSPFEHADRYRRASPGTYVSQITTPLYLIADEKDGNCPPSQAMQLYQRLKLLGVDTELVVYPAEPHTMSIPSHYVDRLYRLVDWFGRYLR